jgi:hypothetical protein
MDTQKSSATVAQQLEALKVKAQANFDILWNLGKVWDPSYNEPQKKIMAEVRKLRASLEPAEKVQEFFNSMADADLEALLAARKAAKGKQTPPPANGKGK